MDYYYNPVRTYIGKDSISKLGDIISSIDTQLKDIVLITRGLDFYKSNEYKVIKDKLSIFNVHEFSFNSSNPDINDVYTLLNKVSNINYNLVIGVGGGSILDIAKALTVYSKICFDNINQFRENITSKKYLDYIPYQCKWIGIPSTSGTGSEVTPFATIWDKEKNLKYSLFSESLYAYASIIDVNMVMSLPVNINISTSLDALCHAIEAYWSRNSNITSRMFSLKAIKLIVENITKLKNNVDSIIVRENLLMGSLFAGLAFSNTKTTSCHSISYPLTMMFNIPHGIATFLSLSKMYEINKSVLINIEDLYIAFGTKDITKKIEEIFNKTDISSKLSSYGIKKENISKLVDKSFTKGRMDNNPVKVEKKDLEKLLISIL